MKHSDKDVLNINWQLDAEKIKRFNKDATENPIGFAEFLLNNLQWINEEIDGELKAELEERMAGYL